MGPQLAASLLIFSYIAYVSGRTQDLKAKILITQIQHLSVQETIRVQTNGHSGNAQIRIRASGIQNYQRSSHTGIAAAEMHDHSNYLNTVGMGESITRIDGVEFRSRHNDYGVVYPSKTSKHLHAIREVEFPEVPESVSNKSTVREQAEEMRTYFKAWQTNNETLRDFHKYFIPLVCYLEGAWFTSFPGQTLSESFASKRHRIDAYSFGQLIEKVQLFEYSGSKDSKENIAVLPATILGWKDNGTTAQLGQWNYRILCQPIDSKKLKLPVQMIQGVEDTAARLFSRAPRTFGSFEYTRAIRFRIRDVKHPITGSKHDYGLLDEIMSQVPGKDNVPGLITSDPNDPYKFLDSKDDSKLLNQAYYHRSYRIKEGNRSRLIYKSFSDDAVFYARTSNDGVVGKEYIPSCQSMNPVPPNCPIRQLERWSVAIPLEIIYLTPLHVWNPHDLIIKVKGYSGSGACNPKVGKPYSNVAHVYTYFITPIEFYDGSNSDRSHGDTVRNTICVLDRKGVKRAMKPSGIGIMLTGIPGVGAARIRYPIYPVYGEGGSDWKELNAVRNLVMDNTYLNITEEKPTYDAKPFTVQLMAKAGRGHTHLVHFSAYDAYFAQNRVPIVVNTTISAGHYHTLEIGRPYNTRRPYFYTGCDSKQYCLDGHPKILSKALR